MQGGHLTHFRKSCLQARQPRALLLAHFCSGSETMLGCAMGGSRACRVSSLLRTGACSLSAASLCQGSSSELLSGDLSSKQAGSNKARETEAFLTLSVQALWEQNKRGFGTSSTNTYLHMHTIGCVLTLWDGSTPWLSCHWALPTRGVDGNSDTLSHEETASVGSPVSFAHLHAA